MSRCFHPRTITLPDGSPQVVRCGKCLSCLEHRQAGWITRLSEEFKAHPDGVYFLTLTYDDEHLPTVLLDGVPHASISTADIKKFNMDLRKRFQQGFYYDDTLSKVGFADTPAKIPLPKDCRFRYYITSEYGPETHRSHYHGFYVGLPPDEDLVFDLFQKIWGKGFITMEKGKSEACAAYVSKYLVNNSLVPVDPRLPKPRAWMSKGLGASYLDSETLVDWHRSAPLAHQYALQNGRKCILPRYLRDRLYDDDMKAQIRDDCVRRDEAKEYAISRKSPYERLRDVLVEEHRQKELYNQAEWHFRKNGKIK